MASRASRFLALLALLGGLALPAPSPAQVTSGETSRESADALVERARELFQRGAEHARRNEWHEALDAFERSARIRPHPATTFNIAFCERALTRYTRARKLFARTLDEDRLAPGELSEETRSQAARYLAEAEQSLARVAIELESDAAISVDGRALEVVKENPLVLSAGTRDSGPPERPPGARFSLLIDPGDHVFEVRGRIRSVTKHHFATGEATTLVLKAPSSPAERRSVSPPRRVEPPPVDAPKKPRPAARSPNRIPAYTAFAVGGLGLIVGSVTGISALSLAGELDEACRSRTTCPRERSDDVERLDRLTLISDVSFGVAAAGALTGGVLMFSGGAASSSDSALPSATPTKLELFAGSAGIGLRARH